MKGKIVDKTMKNKKHKYKEYIIIIIVIRAFLTR